MTRRWIITRCLPTLLLAVAAGACSRRRSARDTAAPAAAVVAPTSTGVAVAVPAAPGVVLRVVARPGTGVYLADSSGRAVYVVDTPAGAPSACTGDCARTWKPVTGQASAAAGDTAIRRGLVGSVTRPDGTTQATYNGMPLYYYTQDQAAGDTRGANRSQSGATSHLVSPQGRAMGGASGQSGTGRD